MKVRELIERLEDLDGEAEVRFAYQENYPLQDDIRGVWTDETGVAFIVSAGQHYDMPYRPKLAFAEAE